MLACAQFGAQVIGSDIDFLMVHARTKPSRVGQKKRIKGESFKGNFEQYTLTAKLLDVIVADASNNPWRDNFNFDAVGNIESVKYFNYCIQLCYERFRIQNDTP